MAKWMIAPEVPFSTRVRYAAESIAECLYSVELWTAKGNHERASARKVALDAAWANARNFKCVPSQADVSAALERKRARIAAQKAEDE